MNQSTPIRRLLRHPVASSESLESSALLAAAAAFAAGILLALIWFWDRELSISGPGSVGQFVALGSAIAAMVTFVGAQILLNAEGTVAGKGREGQPAAQVRLRWYDIAALGLAHAFIALLGWLGIADLMGKSFAGAVVFTLPAAVLAAVAIAVTAYAAFLSAVHLTPMSVSTILIVFLVVGSFASMLSATDPLWWQKNLSSLGITDDISALAFNLTLIIAGVIVTTVAHYATATIPVVSEKELKGRNLVRGALALIGVLLACVGIFPVDEFLTAHNVAATGMAAIFVAMVIGLPRLIPATPRVFVLLGYCFVGIIVVLAIFFVTGYYNLTAVELVAFLLIFSWLVVFLRHTTAMGGPARKGRGDARPDTAGIQTVGL
ncbi:DUF998 domain-containing protein [Arthrobacter glacialis]|uniref:DUF998 domain-containing protein n=1 Tax=Arthrobacter glacialis TaxID=1664 RepID=UPI00105738D0|nr:DUF998 domain-containing protein [Arthrobacter glacialis]